MKELLVDWIIPIGIPVGVFLITTLTMVYYGNAIGNFFIAFYRMVWRDW